MTTTRRLNDSNKVIVTAALTGAVTTKQDNPYLPTQPKEIAEAALRCYEAGAAMVHIHVRDDNDAGSMRFDKFEEAVGLIRASGCPVLLNLTLLRRTGVLLGGAYPPLPGAQTRDGVF